MDKTDKEVLELCKSWFEDIMERSDKLTSGIQVTSRWKD